MGNEISSGKRAMVKKGTEVTCYEKDQWYKKSLDHNFAFIVVDVLHEGEDVIVRWHANGITYETYKKNSLLVQDKTSLRM